MNTYALPAGHTLVLRCCASDMSSANGFVWPGVGEIAEAPDWKKNKNCGNGLHGWLYGQGDCSSSSYWSHEGARWLAVEVEESSIVTLGGKCKFPRGKVVFVGERHEAAAFVMAHEPRAANVAIIGLVAATGDGGVVQVGALGSATAGYRGTATAGDSGTATAGEYGTICIRHWDSKADRYRVKVAYVGEDGIEPNVAYRLDDKLNFVKA